MSNSQDVALWALTDGDNCPALATIKDALASAAPSKYAKNGDVLHPGVTLVDAENGLVHIEALDTRYPGELICALPTAAALDPSGKGHATIQYNTAFKGGADRGLGIWQGVMPVVAQEGAITFVPDTQSPWLKHAYTVGDEYKDWQTVLDYLAKTELPK